jgi:hypothetical protein
VVRRDIVDPHGHQLGAIPQLLPPLRERNEDIPLLVSQQHSIFCTVVGAKSHEMPRFAVFVLSAFFVGSLSVAQRWATQSTTHRPRRDTSRNRNLIVTFWYPSLRGSVADPVGLYLELRRREDKVRLRERSIVHGDLHMSNVALDSTPRGPEAYIFHAGVIRRSTAGRDLGVLEVSVLLHQRLDLDILKTTCSLIYGTAKPLDENTVASINDPVAQNIIEFIRGLRAGIEGWNPPEVHALLVFDFALVQLGGLSFGSSGNRIVDTRATGVLAAFAAEWYRSIANGAPPAQAL